MPQMVPELFQFFLGESGVGGGVLKMFAHYSHTKTFMQF